MLKSFSKMSLILALALSSTQALAGRWSMQLDCRDRRGNNYEVHVAVDSQGTYHSPDYRETYLAAYFERLPESGPRVSGYMHSEGEFTLKGDGYNYDFVSKALKLKLECVRPVDGGASGSN